MPYSEGYELVPGYRLAKFIGRGGFGEVWGAVAPGNVNCAIKIIRLADRQGFREFRAIRMVKDIQHPNLTPIIQFWLKDDHGQILDSSGDQGSIVVRGKEVELIIHMGLGDCSIADKLEEYRDKGAKGIPLEELLGYMEDSARGLDYLNQPQRRSGASSTGTLSIQHCDIKPQNILLMGGVAQICDFGLARLMSDVRRQSQAAGTFAYIAPEILDRNEPAKSSDQYSFALTYHELRTGRLPFKSDNLYEVMNAHLKGNLDFSELAEEEQVVVKRAAALNPEARYPSCVDMVRDLRRRLETRPVSTSQVHLRILGPGSEVGYGYRLVRKIGEGGYGEVWEATAPGGRPSALKIIRNLEKRKGQQEFRALELIRSLEHPHLLDLTAYWLLDGEDNIIPDSVTQQQHDAPMASTLVIATKLASKNLLQRLDECQQTQGGQGGIPVPELLKYMRQAADAIDYLNKTQHRLNERLVAIQHRDIKPENILLTTTGDVKVGDFGLAKIVEGTDAVIRTNSQGLTLAYAAPEMFENRVTSWSDQYSLAITYYHLRLGSRPFATNSLSEIITIQKEGRLNLGRLPEAERAIIQRATSFTPEKRYSTCLEMVETLEHVLHAAPIGSGLYARPPLGGQDEGWKGETRVLDDELKKVIREGLGDKHLTGVGNTTDPNPMPNLDHQKTETALPWDKLQAEPTPKPFRRPVIPQPTPPLTPAAQPASAPYRTVISEEPATRISSKKPLVVGLLALLLAGGAGAGVYFGVLKKSGNVDSTGGSGTGSGGTNTATSGNTSGTSTDQSAQITEALKAIDQKLGAVTTPEAWLAADALLRDFDQKYKGDAAKAADKRQKLVQLGKTLSDNLLEQAKKQENDGNEGNRLFVVALALSKRIQELNKQQGSPEVEAVFSAWSAYLVRYREKHPFEIVELARTFLTERPNDDAVSKLVKEVEAWKQSRKEMTDFVAAVNSGDFNRAKTTLEDLNKRLMMLQPTEKMELAKSFTLNNNANLAKLVQEADIPQAEQFLSDVEKLSETMLGYPLALARLRLESRKDNFRTDTSAFFAQLDKAAGASSDLAELYRQISAVLADPTYEALPSRNQRDFLGELAKHVKLPEVNDSKLLAQFCNQVDNLVQQQMQMDDMKANLRDDEYQKLVSLCKAACQLKRVKPITNAFFAEGVAMRAMPMEEQASAVEASKAAMDKAPIKDKPYIRYVYALVTDKLEHKPEQAVADYLGAFERDTDERLQNPERRRFAAETLFEVGKKTIDVDNDSAFKYLDKARRIHPKATPEYQTKYLMAAFPRGVETSTFIDSLAEAARSVEQKDWEQLEMDAKAVGSRFAYWAEKNRASMARVDQVFPHMRAPLHAAYVANEKPPEVAYWMGRTYWNEKDDPTRKTKALECFGKLLQRKPEANLYIRLREMVREPVDQLAVLDKAMPEGESLDKRHVDLLYERTILLRTLVSKAEAAKEKPRCLQDVEKMLQLCDANSPLRYRAAAQAVQFCAALADAKSELTMDTEKEKWRKELERFWTVTGGELAKPAAYRQDTADERGFALKWAEVAVTTLKDSNPELAEKIRQAAANAKNGPSGMDYSHWTLKPYA